MELGHLGRNDLLQTASCHRHTLDLLPPGKKATRKIVIGDDAGWVRCVSLKKAVVEDVFTHSETLQNNTSIKTTEIGTVVAGVGGLQAEKLFMSIGQQIKGFNKKGKEFFKFNTNVSENICKLHIEGVKIFISGDYILTSFYDTKDNTYLIAQDRIHDMLMLPRRENAIDNPDIVLACQDRCLRFANSTGPTTLGWHQSDVQAVGPVSSLHAYVGASGPLPESLIYGTTTGLVGQLTLLPREAPFSPGWIIQPQKKVGGALNVCSVDLTADGVPDMIIGRDDGNLEVWGFDMGPEPAQQFERSLNECIQSLRAGVLQTAGKQEIILQTYSGKVVLFSDSEAGALAAPGEGGSAEEAKKKGGPVKAAAAPVADGGGAKQEGRVRALRSELDTLRSQLQKEKTAFEKANGSMIATQSQFRINSKWLLDPADASYSLTLEIQMPIDIITLESDVALDIMDLDNNIGVVSKTTPPPGSDCKMLFALQLLDHVNRVELKFKMVEGQRGTLTAFVIPMTTPKSAQVQEFEIKPLCLHTRVPSVEPGRHMNELQLTGAFSLVDMHAWLSMALPEVPDRTPSEATTYHFQSALLNTYLSAQFDNGQATISSDNIMTISVLKEMITKEATLRRVQVKVAKISIKDESVETVLDVLHPKLFYQLDLTRKIDLLDALNEVQMQERDISFMSPELAQILQEKEQIQQEHKNAPRLLEWLHSIVEDLLVAKLRFKNKQVTPAQKDQLKELLLRYDAGILHQFFSQV